MDVSTYTKYCNDTLRALEKLDTIDSVSVEIEDLDMVSLELEDTLVKLNQDKQNLSGIKNLEESSIDDAVKLYDHMMQDVDKLKKELDDSLNRPVELQPVESRPRSSVKIIGFMIFAMFLLASMYQIFGLGDVIQGSLTAIGSIGTRASNKTIKRLGYVTAAAGISGSVVGVPETMKLLNDVASEKISVISDVAQKYSTATIDNVISAFRGSVEMMGEIKGNIFRGGSVEIAGLIEPGDGFRLTDEAIRVLDQSNNIYDTLMHKIALQTMSPPDMAVTVWEPPKKLIFEALARTLSKAPQAGLGSWFSSAISSIPAPKISEIGTDLLLHYGFDILGGLVEVASGGTVPAEVTSQTGKQWMGIGAAEVRMLLEAAKTYKKYK